MYYAFSVATAAWFLTEIRFIAQIVRVIMKKSDLSA